MTPVCTSFRWLLSALRCPSVSFVSKKAPPGRLFRQRAGRAAVHGHRTLEPDFCLIHVGIGGGVEDHIRLRATHRFMQLRGIGQVELATARRDNLTQRRQAALQLPADLSVPAGEQDPHGYTSALRKRVPRLSFSDRTGGCVNCQSIARSGSSQAMVRSCSGTRKSVVL